MSEKHRHEEHLPRRPCSAPILTFGEGMEELLRSRATITTSGQAPWVAAGRFPRHRGGSHPHAWQHPLIMLSFKKVPAQHHGLLPLVIFLEKSGKVRQKGSKTNTPHSSPEFQYPQLRKTFFFPPPDPDIFPSGTQRPLCTGALRRSAWANSS